MSESIDNTGSDLMPVPAHPRHIGIIVKIGREKRPTGGTEFGGRIVIHESGSGFEADLRNARSAAHHLIDGVIEKIRAEGWGAAKTGAKAWDEQGRAIEPPADE